MATTTIAITLRRAGVAQPRGTWQITLEFTTGLKASQLGRMAVNVLLLVVVAMILCMVCAKKSKGPDPKECEVCIANLEAIDGE